MEEVADELVGVTANLTSSETNITAVEVALVSSIVEDLSELAATDEGVSPVVITADVRAGVAR